MKKKLRVPTEDGNPYNSKGPVTTGETDVRVSKERAENKHSGLCGSRRKSWLLCKYLLIMKIRTMKKI